MGTKQKVAFQSLGCKANLYDSIAMQSQIESSDALTVTSDLHQADILVINSCAVTDKSTREARQLAYQSKRRSPETKVVLTGCFVDASPEDTRSIQAFDKVVGNAAKPGMASILEGFDSQPRFIVPPIRKSPLFFQEHLQSFGERTRAFIKVQDGCNNFCTFCIIPKTRGISRSMPTKTVLDQIETLKSVGYNEMVLTGIDLGAYGKDLKPRLDLADLLEEIAANVQGIRIRISSLDPEDLSDRVLAIVAASPIFANHLHLPLQSGHDEILQSMRRSYSSEDFVEAIHRTKEAMPDCAIGTDIITGFPGETEEYFLATQKLVEKLPFTYLHVFPYSAKSGTKAAEMPNQIDRKIAQARCMRLRALGEAKKLDFINSHIGKEVKILVERPLPDDPSYALGYSESYVPCIVKNKSHRQNEFLTGVGERNSNGHLEVTVA